MLILANLSYSQTKCFFDTIVIMGNWAWQGGAMKVIAGFLILVPVYCVSLDAVADTYKCSKGGQTVFSDVPCAPGASRVDAHTDNVSREQRRQAEILNENNRGQLSEPEYRAARERNYRGGVYVLESDPAPGSSSSNRRSR